MSRLSIETPGKAETVIAGLYRDIERRISASPPGLCPVDMSLSFLRLCHAQTPVSVTFYSVGSSGRLTGWVPSSIW